MTKSRNTAASASTLQNVWLTLGAIASERPVPTASTNTRSLTSMRLSMLSTSGNGVGAVERVGDVEKRGLRRVADQAPGRQVPGGCGVIDCRDVDNQLVLRDGS